MAEPARRNCDIGHHPSLVTGVLGKIGQDFALMAQSGLEISMSGAENPPPWRISKTPVRAETLVALARFNAVQLSGLHQATVHEQERSGAAWTLEWLILPQMVMAAAASLRLAGETLAHTERMGTSAPDLSN